MGDIKTRFTLEGEQKFKSAMSGAANAIKVLNSEQKLAKAQFQNTGDAEKYAAQQADILKKKIEQQKIAVKAAEQALKQMAENGVDASSKQFQQWEMKLNSARTSLVNMETELNNVGASMTTASGKAEQFTTSLDSINKKVSFDAVIKGVDAITNGLEKAVKKATDLGKAIWENITDAAKWGDDTATGAMTLGMDVEEYQKYKNVLERYGEITVQEWQKAKQKVQAAIYNPTDNQESILSLLGINTHEMQQGKYGMVQGAARDFEDIFWEIGETLRTKVASGEMTQDLADTYANALFGRGFAGLNSMFGMGREEFEKKVAEETAVQEKYVKQLADLDDAQDKLKKRFEQLEQTVTGSLAPALTGASEVLSGLLENLLEYLNKPEGQEMLQRLGDAVSGLFEDLKNIDPEDVVNSFVTLFTKLVDSFEWISRNWDKVRDGIVAILGVITAGKTISALTTVINAINALKSLGSGGTPTPSPTTEPTTQPTTQPVQRNTDTDNHGPKIPFDPYSLVPLAILGAGTASALIAQGQSIEQIRKTQKELEEAAEAMKEAGSENAEFVERSAAATGLVKDANGNEAKNIIGQSYTQMSDEYGDLLMGLKYRQNAEMAKLVYMLQGYTTLGNDAWNQLNRYWNGNDLDPVEVNDLLNVVTQALKNGRGIDIQGAGLTGPQTEEELSDASGDISQASTDLEEAAKVLEEMPEKTAEAIKNVKVVVTGWPSGGGGGSVYTLGAENVGLFGKLGFHANGLFSVPFDGYRAILHKGERVVPARDVERNTYNTYFGNVNLHNGLEVDALAESIERNNRRKRAGYGAV